MSLIGFVVLISALGIISIIAHAAFQLSALRALERQMTQGSSFGAEEHLQRVLYPPRLLTWLSAKGQSTSSLEVRSRQLQALIGFLGLAQTRDFQGALAQLKLLNDEELLQIAPQGSYTGSIVRSLRSACLELQAAQTELDALGNQLSSLEKLAGALNTDAARIGREFSELLSLPLAQKDPPLYEDGVLRGLPQLKGLADHIADFSALKSELANLGAVVKIEATDAHQAFLERLETLRAGMSATVSGSADLKSQLAKSRARGNLQNGLVMQKLQILRSRVLGIVLFAGAAAVPEQFFVWLGRAAS